MSAEDAAKRYCWSICEEAFFGDCATREEALEEALEAAQDEADSSGEGRSWAWTGVAVPVDVGKLLRWPTVRLIEGLRDAAYDEAGDHVADWLDYVSREQEDALQAEIGAVVTAWLARTNNLPRFHTVDEVVEHEVDVQPSPVDDDPSEPAAPAPRSA